MRHHALAQGNEFGVAHVVRSIIGSSRADDEVPCTVGLEHVIDGRQEREGQLVGDAAQFGGGVVVVADQLPAQFFAGVEIMSAVAADGLVNVLPELLAGQFQMREALAIPNEMRRCLAPQLTAADALGGPSTIIPTQTVFLGNEPNALNEFRTRITVFAESCGAFFLAMPTASKAISIAQGFFHLNQWNGWML